MRFKNLSNSEAIKLFNKRLKRHCEDCGKKLSKDEEPYTIIMPDRFVTWCYDCHIIYRPTTEEA